ncbi:phosphoadenylyl-sulfate reductase [Sphingobacterium cellulitidis]|uniref:Adenosine 5'-phosphosulfate reductase n=1 Tax=Sphingobacterium cellulitidis TaxID=1768011 RepID=A0A8H9G1K3_9SPHI|nr:phosphoadenylyl-sulfate reductase [Sphingobacterium soli]MBA8986571.1 phosphoadenosine phosphosulfate reductase [Sphingobacterium soli]GGE21284.1 phosphoadenosine phosphosulfate reductase [Sphingobacterium soli]
MNTIEQIKSDLNEADARSIIQYIDQNFAEKAVFSTSFGIEDQVLTHFLALENAKINIFTLDTGRLFPETYYVWNRTLDLYNLNIKAFYPQTQAVEQLLETKGPSSFYNSVDDRKECCHIRKIEPLKRAINGYQVWITGIRAEQSINRDQMEFVEWDEQNQIIKIHPLYNWSLNDVEKYLKDNFVPYNPLHDKGFVSIGCQPCTRAVQEGEDFRAGRWWWEDKSKKECGLHVTHK